MTEPKQLKINLIEHFYEHVPEDDWLEGVDLYQAGRVENVSVSHGLLMGKVMSISRPPCEVRVKIHPAGHCIQWIECTCKKNRTSSQYCEHIAAFMIHVDRERPELFGNLDTKMPLKPPPPTRKLKPAPGPERTEDSKSIGAASTIIQHLKGNIQGVSLLAHGPAMRIRIELKLGHLTHYDLDLDSAAKFLIMHPSPPNPSSDVANIQVHQETAELGTRFYQLDAEKIVAERVVAIPANTEKQKKRDIAHGYSRLSAMSPDGTEGSWEFIPLKAASKYLGREYFFVPERGYYPLATKDTQLAWYDLPLHKVFKDDEAAFLVQERFANYINAGVIWLEPQLRKSTIISAPKLAEVRVIGNKDGWFSLDPRYGQGKASVSMASLMRHFANKKRSFIKSGDDWLKIPEFVTEHKWQLDDSGEYVKVDSLGLLRIRAAVGDFDQFVGSKRSLAHIHSHLEFKPEGPTPYLGHTKLTLRSYQESGLRWLWWLYENKLHGLLADEMGLGKTHQAMALMSAAQNAKKQPCRCLVICPTTVLDHWLDKINEFAPNLTPVKYHGTKRVNIVSDVEKNGGTILTSYGILLRDIRIVGEVEWDVVVLDEAHYIKNYQTATYEAVCRLKGRLRLCMTGTPLENHLGELKTLFDFLVPGYLGSDEYFRKQFQKPIEQGVSIDHEISLQKLIHPFKMRRTKNEVLSDLPAKIEDLRHCSLSQEQVKLYNNVLDMKGKALVRKLEDENTPVPYLHVFAVITLLKQVCDHPALILEGENYREHESEKFELFKEIVDEALGSGHKIVVFSQYVGMIKILDSYLKEINIGHVVLTGESRDRGAIIKEFQTNPECKVFCGSLLAGGIGIDLTAASVVVHYDRWWNASKENQATDRVHRIGQNKNVQVLKLVTRGTLEEKIDRMIRSKQSLFEKFLDKDEEIFKSLSRQELIELLQ